MVMTAAKKHQKKAPGSPKISNNFKPVCHRNPPCVAKAGGGVSKPEAVSGMPRNRPQEGTPPKKVQGEDTFVFHIDHERTKAAKIAMLNAAHVNLLVGVRGAKRKDAGDLANPTALARVFRAMNRCETLLDGG